MRHAPSLLVLGAMVLAGCASNAPLSPAGDGGGAGADPGAPVQGNVLDDQLRPLAGVAISVIDREGVVINNATSDQAGSYDLGRVPAGDHALHASLPGYGTLVRRLIVRDGEGQPAVALRLAPLPSAKPFSKMEPKSIHIQYGAAYQAMGDFNRGCLYPSVTCQGMSYPAPAVFAYSDDPEATPLNTVILEEVWTANSPVCSKAMAIDLYDPDAPSTFAPSTENPHYWTNYPHQRWSTKSPIVMVVPRKEAGNSDAMADPSREMRNGGPLYLRGNWTVKHFPPGSGLTGLPVDANCFTDQKIDIYWSVFYGEPPAPGYQGRP